MDLYLNYLMMIEQGTFQSIDSSFFITTVFKLPFVFIFPYYILICRNTSSSLLWYTGLTLRLLSNPIGIFQSLLKQHLKFSVISWIIQLVLVSLPCNSSSLCSSLISLQLFSSSFSFLDTSSSWTSPETTEILLKQCTKYANVSDFSWDTNMRSLSMCSQGRGI